MNGWTINKLRAVRPWGWAVLLLSVGTACVLLIVPHGGDGGSYTCNHSPIHTLFSPDKKDFTGNDFFDEAHQCNTDARLYSASAAIVLVIGVGLTSLSAYRCRRMGRGHPAETVGELSRDAKRSPGN